MMAAIITAAYGGAEAADGQPGAVAREPISLAGRWSGKRYASSMRPPEAETGDTCSGKTCAMTFDIVACDTGWCGIEVVDGTTCGATAMRVEPDKDPNRSRAFTGKLELAKGAAPYVIEAWISSADGQTPPHLSLVGDTGTELLLMRRSFPFQAELQRVADATCKLEKTTS
jgi:hypothetical protein